MQSVQPSPNQASHFSEITELNSTHRWNVYHRLQDLDIPCSCAMGEPLRVDIQNPVTALQLWSVIQQTTLPRRTQIEWLNACWEIK